MSRIMKALTDAYDVCIQVKQFTGNVLASDGEEEGTETDKENYEKSSYYIKWYEDTFKKGGQQ